MTGQSSRKSVILVIIVLVSCLGGGLLGFNYADRTLSSKLWNQTSETNRLQEELEAVQSELNSILTDLGVLEEENEDYQHEVDRLEYRLRRVQGRDPDTILIEDGVKTTGFQIIPTVFQGEPNVLQYTLPLKPSLISNYETVSQNISLSPRAVEMLMENGFVVIENPFNEDEESVQKAYEKIMKRDTPIFVTSDSLLHLYHIQFDETLRNIEEKVFFDDIWNISKKLYNESLTQYGETEGTLKEAHRRNAAYFAVALSLLAPDEAQLFDGEYEYFLHDSGEFYEEDYERYNFTVSPIVLEDVESELEKISASQGFSQSTIFIYNEDFSQYVPRGHYTRSEKLKNYFKAVMWFGRMSMLLKGDENIPTGEIGGSMPPFKAIISEYDAKVQTKQACSIALQMIKNGNIWSRWKRVYEVTSFYVGVSDDLGPYEYMDALQEVFTEEISLIGLDEETLIQLKLRLAEHNPPAIYGGTGNVVIDLPITADRLDEVLNATLGFRFMGQRFVPDSYIFQELVVPSVQSPTGGTSAFTCVNTDLGFMRGYARGLDVMAVLGSKRAEELLEELGDSNYVNYDNQYEMLVEEFNGFSDENWNRNLYWSWLNSLRPLLKEYGEGYPTFMQTEAWSDKQLTAALSSWSQLRHDTILYAKQSYGVALCGTAVLPKSRGYVEPVPEFYARLLDLTKMTRRGLTSYDVLDSTSASRLVALEEILDRLLDISTRELNNEPLTDEDYVFIRNFGEILDDVLVGVDDKAKKTTIIADVHTETNTRQVLEEGTGYLRTMVVAYRLPDGSINIGAGPVFSYFEFKQPMSERLTDEAWREMLSSNPPDNPEWVQNFTE